MPTCSDVEPRLDAFVDGELAPSDQIDVARHLAGCAACNAVVEGLLAVRDGLVAMADAAVDALPLATVWPRVAARVEAAERRGRWRRGGQRLPAVPMWAAGMAMAAGALLLLRAVQPAGDGRSGGPELLASHVARSATIQRVVGNVDVRHDPKNGAAIILVHDAAEARPR